MRLYCLCFNIAGLQSFASTLAHTGNYPPGLDLACKRVAVIGAGSSAIQVVPTVQPVVKSLVNFFVGRLDPGGRATVYTEQQKQQFRDDPAVLLAYRREVDHELNSRFPNFYKGSPQQQASRDIVEKSMRERLYKMAPVLREQLVPKLDVGCKRVTLGEGYLEALQEANVELVRDGIAEVTATGVVTASDKTYEVDIIIAATSYDTSYVPAFAVTGRAGVDLGQTWAKTGAEAYFTCAVPDMPNYFNALLMPSIEAWCKGGTVTGRIAGPWPGSFNHFLESVRSPRFQDFEFTYRSKNHFAYLGNSLTLRDIKKEDLG
ncbi:hypothetical protein B0T26DRAFT_675006 [Lasiosphaeria miniovina]|uniref:FAD/NAD(P)-binding domain-containing protein n=1 Tax=Lasiosphaeria miniovina TaxID=1954250 RepID=A0AA40AWW6_9PEZI|nr:uncharacterized protein B0T26DRAFT_675006 [Lasiosphaeria miniovina]KAK0723436.1 hypothetical protein B0T26DRAFT_675006 [Lasiosphaeria miniovina]